VSAVSTSDWAGGQACCGRCLRSQAVGDFCRVDRASANWAWRRVRAFREEWQGRCGKPGDGALCAGRCRECFARCSLALGRLFEIGLGLRLVDCRGVDEGGRIVPKSEWESFEDCSFSSSLCGDPTGCAPECSEVFRCAQLAIECDDVRESLDCGENGAASTDWFGRSFHLEPRGFQTLGGLGHLRL